MQKDHEWIEMPSLLSKRTLKLDLWVLSYIRKPNKDYAFLLLEGINEGRHLCKVAKLGYKDGIQNTKAAVSFVDVSAVELTELCQGCVGFSYDMIPEQYQDFINLVEAETRRSEIGVINYVKQADSITAGSVAGSLEASGSEGALNASQASAISSHLKLEAALEQVPAESSRRMRLSLSRYCTESVIKLIVHGHNSCSWAVCVLDMIKIPTHYTLNPIVINPPEEQPSADRCCGIK